MDFEYSAKTKELQAKLLKFMDDYIYPAEREYEQEMDANTKEALRHNTMNLLLANGYLDQSVFDRANQDAGGHTYTAPPEAALLRDDQGDLVDPPQFDFDSDAYDTWATTVGVEGALTNQMVDRYNASWPNVR